MDIFRLAGKIAIDNSGAVEALQETSSEGSSTQSRLQSAFKKIGAAVGTYFAVSKLVDFGTQLATLAGDAETAAAKVNTLLAQGTDTADYYQQMLDASTATGVAFSEMSESVYQAMSAGVAQENAVAFVKQAIQLAKGGFTDTATAVDVLTTAINAYGLTADDASHLADVLITTQNLGKTSVAELASYMGKAIPTASAYGVSMENLSAAYAVLTANGIATADSTTTINAMLNELGSDSSDVAKILKNKTGKNFAQLMEAGLSLGEVIQILNDSVQGDSTAFNNLWSSTEAGKGALSIVGSGVEKYNSVMGQMQNSSGATETAYTTMVDTFNEKFEKMKNTISNIGITIGNEFLPALKNILDGVNEWLGPAFENIQSLFNGTVGEDGSIDWSLLWSRFRDACGKLIAKIPQYLKRIGAKISKVWGDTVWPAIKDLFKAEFGVDLPDWSTVSAQLTTWWNTFKDKATEILSIVFGIEGGLTWEEVKNKFVTWWNDKHELVKAIFQAVFGIEGGASWEDVSEKFQTWWDGVSELVGNIFKAVFKIGGGPEWEQVSTVFTNWWNSVSDNVSAVFSAVWKLADGTLTWEDVENIFTTWWKTIKTSAEGALQLTWQVIAPFAKSVNKVISDWWNGSGDQVGVKQQWKDSFKFVFGVDFDQFWQDVNEWWNSIVEWWNTNIVNSDWYKFLTGGAATAISGTEISTGTYQQDDGRIFDQSLGWSDDGGLTYHWANGTDFVSKDRQPAILHYGEAVLNRTDAKAWRDGSGNAGMLELGDKMDAMAAAVVAAMNSNRSIVLDTGVLVGSTAGMYDSALGRRANRKGRGN